MTSTQTFSHCCVGVFLWLSFKKIFFSYKCRISRIWYLWFSAMGLRLWVESLVGMLRSQCTKFHFCIRWSKSLNFSLCWNYFKEEKASLEDMTFEQVININHGLKVTDIAWSVQTNLHSIPRQIRYMSYFSIITEMQ